MVQNQNLKRRIVKIEDRWGIAKNEEIIEIPMDDGWIYRFTQRQLDHFVEWLKGRENNG